MNSKGFLLSILAVAAAALIWHVLIGMSGWSLWLLAPFVGLAAGMGMSGGGKVKAGVASKLCAVAFTLVAIVGVRIGAVNRFMAETYAVTDETAVESMAASIAEQMSAQGEENVYTIDGDFSPHIYAAAQSQWDDMLATDKSNYIRSLEDEHQEAAAFLSPFVLLFDFGIFGSIWTIVSCTTAFSVAGRVDPALAAQEGSIDEPVKMAGLPGMPPPVQARRFDRDEGEDRPVVGLPGMPPPTSTTRRFDVDEDSEATSDRKAA